MYTRSKAREMNQPVLVNDEWTDVYIATKDEQIEALQKENKLSSWEDDESSNEEYSDIENEEKNWDNESSSSDEEEENIGSKKYSNGFFANVYWTLMCLSVIPILFWGLCNKGRSRSRWPLKCRSIWRFIFTILLNIGTIIFICLWFYAVSCVKIDWELNEVQYMPLNKIQNEILSKAMFIWTWGPSSILYHTIHPVYTQLPMILMECLQEYHILQDGYDGPCMKSLINAYNNGDYFIPIIVYCTAGIYLVLFYKKNVQRMVLGTTILWFVYNYYSAYNAQQAAIVRIDSLDPKFAYVNESIFIAIDGQNLEQDATLSWRPFWPRPDLSSSVEGNPTTHIGLASEGAAVKLLEPVPLRSGGVYITFSELNEYFPCYKGKTFANNSYICFTEIRIRVKDERSMPGWSLGRKLSSSSQNDANEAEVSGKHKKDDEL